MRKTLLTITLLLTLFISETYAQVVFRINDFSEKYTVIHTIDNITQENSAEYFILYSKSDNQMNKPLLEYGEISLRDYAIKHAVKAPVMTYKNMYQSNFYQGEDYNFDGVKDIIILDPGEEDEGCYTSQQNANIFISNANGTFYYNQPLSDKFNESMCLRRAILFTIPENKEICFSQSGGAYSEYSEFYKFENDTLRLFKTNDLNHQNFLYSNNVEKQLKDGKWVTIKSHRFFLSEEKPEPILSFDTENNKGKVFVFGDTFYVNGKDSNSLYYAFMIDNDVVEFAFPDDPEKADKMRFRLKKSKNRQELEFNSGTIVYTIYETSTSLGIKVNVNGKEHDWKGNLSNKKGSLNNLNPEIHNNLDIVN